MRDDVGEDPAALPSSHVRLLKPEFVVRAAKPLPGKSTEELPSAVARVRVQFGSEDSRDNDILYVLDQLPSADICKALCSHHSQENRNLAVLHDGCIQETYKGLPGETNNAVFYTAGLHLQNGENPVQRPVIRNVPLKLVRAVRIILSLLTRTSLRSQVKASLQSNSVAERHALLATIDFSRHDLPAEALKAAAYQLAQTIALIDGHEYYTKSELIENCPDLADLIGRRSTSASTTVLNQYRDALLHRINGVYVRQQGDLNLFMYGNALAIDSWNQFARQSRGMIIDVARERCVSFPMDKFFRFGEGPELDRDAMDPELPVEVVEKVDGSMVSLLHHEGRFRFACKGNFTTQQSIRAEKIGQRLPLHKLQADRFYHIFEVIYPENRFPQGLSIVDYGNREDLVLIAMRDRITNRLLSYSELVHEAQRAGISHPRVFELSLREAFEKVDNADAVLGFEGYVIRSIRDQRYFKLKYPAYKRVLELINDMRSSRFVRDYVSMKSAERSEIRAILPPDLLRVAESQLLQHSDIVDRLRDYLAAVCHRGPADPTAFAAWVTDAVPELLQRAVFLHQRGRDATQLLEKIAVGVLEQRIAFPSLPGDELPQP
jgi:hypothetical protein